MYLKIFKQSKAFISIILLLLLVVGTIVYMTVLQVYDLEMKLQDKNEKAELQIAKEVVEVYFSKLGEQLLFLKDLDITKQFARTNFKSNSLNNEIQRSFKDLLSKFEDISHVSIIDPSGNEITSIISKNYLLASPGPDSGQLRKEYKSLYKDSMKLDNGKIYVSTVHMDLEDKYSPYMYLSVPLFDAGGGKNGILAFTVYIPNIFKNISHEIYIITGENEGMIVSLKHDGAAELEKADNLFRGNQGNVRSSTGMNIYYLAADLLSSRSLLLGKKHDIESFKSSLVNLALIPGVLIFLMVFLIILVAYFNMSRHKEVVMTQKTLIHSLANLTEWRDNSTGCHLKRTAKYAVALSRFLQKKGKFKKIITNSFIDDISDASPLHDIGKVGIRDDILLKPGKLTNEEYEQMKKHVDIGKDVLDKDISEFKNNQTFIIMSRNICAYHHEKYNGNGYAGLKGNDIPLEARIFAICDVYDAIRAVRPYEPEVSHEEAVERIRKDRGTHFDPDILDAFIECSDQFLEISKTC